MEDHLGIVYVIETAQQFWSELEDTLRIPGDNAPTLSWLDSTLRRFLTLCANYHEKYLQSPLQLEHAFDLLHESELFQFHSERMCDNVVGESQQTSDPHRLFVLYSTLFYHGRRRVEALRNPKRWQPVIPLLMDHIRVDIDPDIEDSFFGGAVPIEFKLRSLAVKLLYELCKVQKMTVQDLRAFDDSFIDHLYDLVEQTKLMQDDAFNYSVIKLIVALNEQFMVAGIVGESSNRVVSNLVRRYGHSQAFGENLIFMLNRAKHTPEDLCTQLLILKLLYVLFSTKGLEEYFYTNDLCVLVDVFLRELANLDERHESLRHTYLRVFHPLLTKTQLRSTPYKRPQIMALLESLVGNANIRDVNSTTKRLVERCLSGEWCIQLRANQPPPMPGSPHSDTSSILSPPSHMSTATFLPAEPTEAGSSANRLRNLKFSKSVENLGMRPDHSRAPPIPRSPLDQVRGPNMSTLSLNNMSSHKKTPSPPIPQRRSTTMNWDDTRSIMSGSSSSSASLTGAYAVADARPTWDADDHGSRHPSHHRKTSIPIHPIGGGYVPHAAGDDGHAPRTTRRPPPLPPKRRKPPAIPTDNGVTMYPIKSSESPLSKLTRVSSGV